MCVCLTVWGEFPNEWRFRAAGTSPDCVLAVLVACFDLSLWVSAHHSLQLFAHSSKAFRAFTPWRILDIGSSQKHSSNPEATDRFYGFTEATVFWHIIAGKAEVQTIH